MNASVPKQPITIHLNGESYQPDVRYSRRKTAMLEIRHGQLVVRVPLRTSTVWVQSFIQSRMSWIEKHVVNQAEQMRVHLPDPIEQGRVLLRGQSLNISFCVMPIAKSYVELTDDGVDIAISQRVKKLPSDAAISLLKDWLFDQADQFFQQRTSYWSRQMKLIPSHVKTANFKRMWGRCSSKGEIALNWRLIMAPDAAIDYVIIHELVHLAEFNHSPVFWARVASTCPDYKEWKLFFQDRSSWLLW